MVSTRSMVWLGLVLASCAQGGHGLLNSDSQDLSYNYPSADGSGKLPSLDSPTLDGIAKSLLNEPYAQLSPENDRRPSYPTRGNIRKSFSLETTTSTTTPRTEPHFEALYTSNGDDSQRPRKKTLYINNEKVEVDNSQELIDKFKALKRNPGIRSTERSPYDRRTYEERLQESSSLGPPLDSQGPNGNLRPLPIRHWSTESNVIRDDELRGSSYPYSYSTSRPPSHRPYNYRGNVRYNMPITENPIRPSYDSGYDNPRTGKYVPDHLFRANIDNRNLYITPTTYRPPFRGDAYSFSFKTENHSRQESGDTRGNFRGSVKYMDTLGRDKQIDYEGNPQRGLVTSEAPLVTVAGRTGQRYIPQVTTPRPYTPNGMSYSYSYRTDDPVGSSTVPYGDYIGYSSTARPLIMYSTPTIVSRPIPDGSYVFSYNAGDHERQEVRDRNGNVRGMYSYEGPDGKRNHVQYTADATNGFVAQGSHIPVQQGRIPSAGVQDYPGSESTPGGSYYFSYNAGDHARQEVRDDAGNVHGSFSFVTADGDTRTVNYQAKPEDGFAVSGAHIPYTVGK